MANNTGVDMKMAQGLTDRFGVVNFSKSAIQTISNEIETKKSEIKNIRSSATINGTLSDADKKKIEDYKTQITVLRGQIQEQKAIISQKYNEFVSSNDGMKIPAMYARAKAFQDMVNGSKRKMEDLTVLKQGLEANPNLQRLAKEYAEAYAKYKENLQSFNVSNPLVQNASIQDKRDAVKIMRSDVEAKKKAFKDAWEKAHGNIGQTDLTDLNNGTGAKFSTRTQRTPADRALSILGTLGDVRDDNNNFDIIGSIENKMQITESSLNYRQQELDKCVTQALDAGVRFEGINSGAETALTPSTDKGWTWMKWIPFIGPLREKYIKSKAQKFKDSIQTYGERDFEKFKNSDKKGFLKDLWVNIKDEVSHEIAENDTRARRDREQDGR